jgi:hypothetical protein
MKYWRKLSGEPIRGDIQEAVRSTLIAEKNNKLKVCIGTDSQVKGNITEFATAIVFIREGKGGFIFLRNFRTEQPFTIKERMIREVSESIEIAYLLCPLLEEFKVELEVHADINSDPQFKSNVAFKEAMGYILGMGFSFKAKPEAFASTYCANKAVK